MTELNKRCDDLKTAMLDKLKQQSPESQKDEQDYLKTEFSNLKKTISGNLDEKFEVLSTAILETIKLEYKNLKMAVLQKTDKKSPNQIMLTELKEKKTKLCLCKFCKSLLGTLFILVLAICQFLLIQHFWSSDNSIPMSILIVMFVVIAFALQCVILVTMIRTIKKLSSIINRIELIICKEKFGGGISKDEMEREMRYFKILIEQNSSPLVINFFK